jgi:hypothetical protein
MRAHFLRRWRLAERGSVLARLDFWHDAEKTGREGSVRRGDAMRQKMLRAALWAVLCGCGGASTPATQEPAQPAESAGADAILPEEESTAEAAPSEAAPVARPATLTVMTKVGSDPAKAQVRVTGENMAPVEGTSGAPLAVLSGDLEIEATLSDSKLLHGHETVHRSVTVAPGENATTTVMFERCLARVEVRVRGKLDTSAVVTLTKDGETLAKLQSGDKDYVPIAPGRYGASVKSQRAEITSSDVTLNEGAKQTVPINVN